MTKYDFGYDIVPESPIAWAYDIVAPNSIVLELGPAIGTLTKHLKEDKQCQIDIVEYDVESGNRARQFARKSCIGPEEGNLELEKWKNVIGEFSQYDYIIILDVLEHLKNSFDVLKYVGSLLKEDGEILLSLPNVAHNSVLIDLLNNKFNYTSVGLLDDTHIHFFTQASLDEMIIQNGLYAYKKEYKQMYVGETEIVNNYNDVPAEIEEFLRTRQGADIYQFLYRIKKGQGISITDNYFPLPYTLYPLEIYSVEGDLLCVRHINPSTVEEDINLQGIFNELRLDPLNQPCCIKNLKIQYKQNGEWFDAKIKLTNGIAIQNDALLFLDNDSQIYIEGFSGQVDLKISFACQIFSAEKIDLLQKIADEYLKMQAQTIELSKYFEKNQILEQKLLEKNEELHLKAKAFNLVTSESQELKKKLLEKTQELHLTEEKLNLVINELSVLKNTKIYKFIHYFKKYINSVKEK